MTKETFPREEMLRFVRSPDRTLVFDVTGKLPGRGIWLKADYELVSKAVQKRMFSKPARQAVITPPDLVEQIETALRGRVLSLMGLARKAGVLVFGFEGVKKAVSESQIVLAFEAKDASEREQYNLYHNDQIEICKLFTREELGSVMGQDAVVHVGLLKSRSAEELAKNVRRMNLFFEGKEKG